MTWFIASPTTPPGVPGTALQPGASNSPPMQGPRVQSMATEVAAGATTTLTWPYLKPGTYLLESGTHPSIQVPMGLIGVLVVTTAPTPATTSAAAVAGTAYPAVPYNAELAMEFSEIDPVQNTTVNAAVNTAGFTETAVWSVQAGGCGNPSSPNYLKCYPPAVNYTPLYYLINGVAFNKTNAAGSLFGAYAGIPGSTTPPATTGITGTVLVRVLNAGSRLHVPSIVNSLTRGFNGAGASATVAGFTLIAEDGNVLPNVAPPGAAAGTVPVAPRVQTDVLMVPSKVYDALINIPTPGGVTAIAITAGGTGYYTVAGSTTYTGNGTIPACSTTVTVGCVSISGGGGTGAAATATVAGGSSPLSRSQTAAAVTARSRQ